MKESKLTPTLATLCSLKLRRIKKNCNLMSEITEGEIKNK